ncbi:MAG: hypothetical protein J7K85_09515 [Anaerolineaceae bacterium]|nr:hypothetical protein [Anaerolineaceae bacterium]
MSSKRIFLHIGTHKTATTTIQKGCVENSTALRNAGWLYPATGMFMVGQHNIAWEMASRHEQPWNYINYWVRFRPEWGGVDALKEEIDASSAENVILSSEDFDGLRTERIQLLAEKLSSYTVEVIVYLREQTSLLQSAWAQFIKSGFITIDFAGFLDDMLAASSEKQRYFGAYDLFLQPWMAAFGSEHVHPKQFSRDVFQGNVFHDFLLECKVPDVERYTIPENQNISPGLKCLELIRILGSKVETMEQRYRLSRVVQYYIDEIGCSEGKLNLIDRDIHDRVHAHFDKANQWVGDHFFDGESLFRDSFNEKPLSIFDKNGMIGEDWERLSVSVVGSLLNNTSGLPKERS